MNEVILITGAVRFQINLDPTIWIVDERKIPMEEYFPGVEGYGMKLSIFLEHAEPDPDATHVICHQSDGNQIKITLEEARSGILRFTRDGKPIRPDGPALLYLQKGSLAGQPIGYLTKLELVAEK